MIRLIIVLILFFPMNGIFAGCSNAVSISEGEVSSFSYDQQDFFVNADELACMEEIQEEEGIVLVVSDYEVRKFNRVVVLRKPSCQRHLKVLQIKAYFYTNLPPPGVVS